MKQTAFTKKFNGETYVLDCEGTKAHCQAHAKESASIGYKIRIVKIPKSYSPIVPSGKGKDTHAVYIAPKKKRRGSMTKFRGNSEWTVITDKGVHLGRRK
jgi:hypothetical protein